MLNKLPLLAVGAAIASAVVAPKACDVLPEGWTRLPGSYQKVAYDGSNICAIDTVGGLWCSTEAVAPISWKNIPGLYADIGLSKGALYARKADAKGTMVVTHSITDVAWSQVNLNYGAEVQTSFSVGDSTLCESTSTGRFVCTSTTAGLPYTWSVVDGNMVESAIGGPVLFGLDAVGNLFQGTTATTNAGMGKWKAASNQTLRTLSFDGSQLCGIDDCNTARCTTSTIATPAPPSQCCFKDGDALWLQSDTGLYLGRCNGCIPGGAYSDAAFVHVPSPGATTCGTWTVKNMPNGRIALQSDTGKYLARCNGCATGANYPDEAFVHSSDPTTPWSQWTCQDMGNGKIALQADTGNYLARCYGCVPGSYPNVGMLHVTNPKIGPWSQWTVYQGGKTSANRCPVKTSEPLDWAKLPGEWTDLATFNGTLFGVDTSNRLFTRNVGLAKS
ncbi:cytochrome P450 [Achlya hypogyna]|uniref:Cytochrome P450 n=1 Tax=Achlya hypogyna TaxID=1202772 RepID=A0A0A7CNX3_ACHHY|nr:secreted protein [Achlya hypogyna]OQR86572.1 cytochrome P450 [Achlya hypogyna]